MVGSAEMLSCIFVFPLLIVHIGMPFFFTYVLRKYKDQVEEDWF